MVPPSPVATKHRPRQITGRARFYMNQYGFVRITCVSPRTTVANPSANAAEIVRVLEQVPDSDVVVFPELCVTGYTCADLFGQSALLEAGHPGHRGKSPRRPRAVRNWWSSAHRSRAGNSLFNFAVVISDGVDSGNRPQAVPAQLQGILREPLVQPGGRCRAAEIDLGDRRVPFGIDLLFEARGPPWRIRLRQRRGGRRDLRGPLGAGATQLASRPWPERPSCSTFRPATRRSARAGTAPTW